MKCDRAQTAWQPADNEHKILCEGIVWGIPKEGDEGWIVYPVMRSIGEPENGIEDLLITLAIDGEVKPHDPIVEDIQSLKRALRRARKRKLRFEQGWEYFSCFLVRTEDELGWIWEGYNRNLGNPS